MNGVPPNAGENRRALVDVVSPSKGKELGATSLRASVEEISEEGRKLNVKYRVYRRIYDRIM
jgi:hypothetical protein